MVNQPWGRRLYGVAALLSGELSSANLSIANDFECCSMLSRFQERTAMRDPNKRIELETALVRRTTSTRVLQSIHAGGDEL